MDKGSFFRNFIHNKSRKIIYNTKKDTEESDLSDLLEENKKLWDYVEELENELDELASIYANDLTYISNQLKVEETRREQDDILQSGAQPRKIKLYYQGSNQESVSVCQKLYSRDKLFFVFVLLRNEFNRDYPIDHPDP